MYLYIVYEARQKDVEKSKCGEFMVDKRYFPYKQRAISIDGIYDLKRTAVKRIKQLNDKKTYIELQSVAKGFYASGDQFDTMVGIVRNGKLLGVYSNTRGVDIPKGAEKRQIAIFQGKYYLVKNENDLIQEKTDENQI